MRSGRALSCGGARTQALATAATRGRRRCVVCYKRAFRSSVFFCADAARTAGAFYLESPHTRTAGVLYLESPHALYFDDTLYAGSDLFLIPAVDMLNHSTDPKRRATELAMIGGAGKGAGDEAGKEEEGKDAAATDGPQFVMRAGAFEAGGEGASGACAGL